MTQKELDGLLERVLNGEIPNEKAALLEFVHCKCTGLTHIPHI